MPSKPKTFRLAWSPSPKDNARARDALRPNARERGYDWAWEKVRAWHMREEPLCRHCLERDGRCVPGEVVDHIRPINLGGERLDPDNLQTLCRRCHAAKTRTDGSYG